MRIYLETLGCRLNYAEMAALGRQLIGVGHELAESAAEADLCVLNSCAVTGDAARHSRQLARRLARTNPAAPLIITGCYATLEDRAVAQLPNVALVVGNTRKDELLALVQEYDVRQAADRQPPTANASSRSRTRAFIKVQDGCRNHCTFCIVTVARGDERSRPVAEIVAEVNALHAEGYQEAVLTGVHLGGYGSERGAGLTELVAALVAETRIPRLRLSSLEPFDVAPAFFDLWAMSGGRLMPHLHLPAQSGSDAILRRMARRNRVADFEALVAAARARIPGLAVTTDLIVGFPGETAEDFGETMAFARRVGFMHLHVFPYSARAGTAAARFGGQAPEVERKRRARALNDLDAELGTALRCTFIGETRPVLWENSEQPPEQTGFEPIRISSGGSHAAGCGHGSLRCYDTEKHFVWSGLTDNYLRVLAAAPAGLDLHNTITPTRLVRAEGDALWGEIVTR